MVRIAEGLCAHVAVQLLLLPIVRGPQGPKGFLKIPSSITKDALGQVTSCLILSLLICRTGILTELRKAPEGIKWFMDIKCLAQLGTN